MNQLKALFFNALFLLGTMFSAAFFIAAEADEAKPLQEIVVLGVAQDAGYPQMSCYRPHCKPGWTDKSLQRLATSIAVIDHQSKEKYLFEATPDIKFQLYQLHLLAPDSAYRLAGVFLTHAHMGHYTGLIHFGREAVGSKEVPVFAMPKMKMFLESNGPWSQLVKLKNILIQPIDDNKLEKLNENISVTPLRVPHRDEFSETVGFRISGPDKSALFLPDIDKWEKWKLSLVKEISKVDYALLDASFFANGELPNRDMSEVPHPFVEETMLLLAKLPVKEKQKVIFIHFNHTNPLIQMGSEAQKTVLENGFQFATEGMRLPL